MYFQETPIVGRFVCILEPIEPFYTHAKSIEVALKPRFPIGNSGRLKHTKPWHVMGPLQFSSLERIQRQRCVLGSALLSWPMGACEAKYSFPLREIVRFSGLSDALLILTSQSQRRAVYWGKQVISTLHSAARFARVLHLSDPRSPVVLSDASVTPVCVTQK